MSLAVVIPSKTASNLDPCLEAIWKHDPTVEPIIVDDGVDWSQMRNEQVLTVVKGEKPFIFARNVNLGIHAAGNWQDIIVCNDDALLETLGGFTEMQRQADQHPEYGIIGATTDITGQPLQFRQHRFGGLREVPHFAFICVLIPRRTINRIGLMDERYCLDYGCCDLDYCTAVTQAGLKCAVFDGCFVNHSTLISSFRGAPKTPRSFQLNYGLYKEKWGNLAL